MLCILIKAMVGSECLFPGSLHLEKRKQFWNKFLITYWFETHPVLWSRIGTEEPSILCLNAMKMWLTFKWKIEMMLVPMGNQEGVGNGAECLSSMCWVWLSVRQSVCPCRGNISVWLQGLCFLSGLEEDSDTTDMGAGCFYSERTHSIPTC